MESFLNQMRSAASASSDTSSKSLTGLIFSAGRGSDSGATVGLPSARVISASTFVQRRGLAFLMSFSAFVGLISLRSKTSSVL